MSKFRLSIWYRWLGQIKGTTYQFDIFASSSDVKNETKRLTEHRLSKLGRRPMQMYLFSSRINIQSNILLKNNHFRRFAHRKCSVKRRYWNKLPHCHRKYCNKCRSQLSTAAVIWTFTIKALHPYKGHLNLCTVRRYFVNANKTWKCLRMGNNLYLNCY